MSKVKSIDTGNRNTKYFYSINLILNTKTPIERLQSVLTSNENLYQWINQNTSRIRSNYKLSGETLFLVKDKDVELFKKTYKGVGKYKIKRS